MRALLVILTLIFAFGTSSQVHAQTSLERDARDLFQQGITAARAERWEEARELFESSYAADPRPSTLVNLAGAYARTQKYVEAIRSYEAFLELSLPPNLERLRPSVQVALEDARGKVAQVTLNIRGMQQGDRVLLDGEPLDASTLSAPQRVNPGAHTARVQRNNRSVADRSFNAHESEQLSLDLLVARTRPDATREDPNPEPEPEPTPSGPSDWRTPVGWTGVGVGVAGLAVGVALHVMRENTVSGYASDCASLTEMGRAAECVDLRADAQSKVDAYTAGAIAGYVIGGAALVTGVVLLVLPRRRAQSEDHATVMCAPSLGQIGVSCAGTF